MCTIGSTFFRNDIRMQKIRDFLGYVITNFIATLSFVT